MQKTGRTAAKTVITIQKRMPQGATGFNPHSADHPVESQLYYQDENEFGVIVDGKKIPTHTFSRDPWGHIAKPIDSMNAKELGANILQIHMRLRELSTEVENFSSRSYAFERLHDQLGQQEYRNAIVPIKALLEEQVEKTNLKSKMLKSENHINDLLQQKFGSNEQLQEFSLRSEAARLDNNKEVKRIEDLISYMNSLEERGLEVNTEAEDKLQRIILQAEEEQRVLDNRLSSKIMKHLKNTTPYQYLMASIERKENEKASPLGDLYKK